MSNEPERPIEKLLRDAAKKRADDAGAPLDLHPATRRLLQGEVTRKFEKQPPKHSLFLECLSPLWPRLAWSAAILVVMAAAVWVMVPRPGVTDEEVAMAQRGSKEEPAVTSAAAPSPEPAPAPVEPPPRPTATPAGKLDTPTIVNGERTAGERDKDSSVYKNTPLSAAAMPAPSVAKPEVAANEKKTSDLESDGVKHQEAEKMKAPAEDRFAAKDAPAPSAASNHSYYALNSSAAELSRSVTPAPASAPTPTTTTASAPPAGFGGAAMPGAVADGSRKQAEANALAFNNRKADASAGSTISGSTIARDESNGALSPAPATLASRSAAPAQKSAKSDHMVESLSFSDDVIAKAEALSKNGAPQVVLNSFRLEQHGSDLRIIDADGSVYSGYLQPSTRAYRRRAAGQPAPATTLQDAITTEGGRAPVAPAAVPSESQAYTFRVTGTNLTLHKKVVFQGSLTTVTNLALGGTASNTFGGFKTFGIVPLQQSTPVNSSISGKLSVGGAKEIDINAAPSSP